MIPLALIALLAILLLRWLYGLARAKRPMWKQRLEALDALGPAVERARGYQLPEEFRANTQTPNIRIVGEKKEIRVNPEAAYERKPPPPRQWKQGAPKATQALRSIRIPTPPSRPPLRQPKTVEEGGE